MRLACSARLSILHAVPLQLVCESGKSAHTGYSAASRRRQETPGRRRCLCTVCPARARCPSMGAPFKKTRRCGRRPLHAFLVAFSATQTDDSMHRNVQSLGALQNVSGTLPCPAKTQVTLQGGDELTLVACTCYSFIYTPSEGPAPAGQTAADTAAGGRPATPAAAGEHISTCLP